ncbi:hypothetical protein K1T71_002272 [Dendrolimus kikuchii]|uniref:Uncharacterized protein n=1 Tax=Dendrolimus kikuchii TaxID=765133 RepID=A0ACC1DCI4_9NEOP|nr:hypothetical protein K1T71_002272 [Dendrolimus kikuchii]
MSNLEDEIRDLREKNNELVQKVQYWKMTAAQREDEKLALMKEINELRLKLSSVKNSSKMQSKKIEATIQAGNEKALAFLVRASSEIANIMEATKSYFTNMQQLDTISPRWSAIGGSPSLEKPERVHRVPPTLVGGRSIQPVVSLSRTLINSSAIISRSPNQSRSSERAVPIHMLQDVYIPLTRIDAGMHGNIEVDAERNDDLEDSTEDLGLEDDTEQLSEVEEFEAIPRLDVVAEDIETEEETLISSRSRIDDGLEGPSWLLGPPPEARTSTSNSRLKEEPDSTTEVQEAERELSPSATTQTSEEPLSPARPPLEFSPTVRRRKRAGSPVPPATPRLAAFTPRLNRRNSVNERVLKVMVTKMRLSGDGEGGVQRSPPKRPKPDRLMSLDAPSPSGTTDSRVIVLDTSEIQPDISSPVSHITVRGHSSRREKQHDRHKHNKHACRSDQDDHADQSEWNNQPEQLELNEQNDIVDQGDRSEANLPEDQNKFSSQNKFKSLSRKERHKRRELSRCKQNEYAGQSDQYNRGDPIEDAIRSVKCEPSDRHEQRDRSVNRDKSNSHEDRDGNVSREQRDQSVGRERSVNREQRDRSVSRDRSNRHERRGRSDRREQNEPPERNDRGEHVDRSNHNEHSQQNGEHDRYESNEYRARSDLSERTDRHDRSNGNERNVTRRDRSDQTRHSSRDSDSESISESITEGRSRRIRKTVTYKEKPLNRKMRR